MKALSPIVRISLALVFATLTIVITADFLFGLAPEHARPLLEARKNLTETLAVQATTLAPRNDLETLKRVLSTVVQRQSDVLSIGLRLSNGELVVDAGDHRRHWNASPGDDSTPTHAQVPIFNDQGRWGSLEVRFTDLNPGGWLEAWNTPYIKALLFVMMAGFITYLFFMKKTLRHLDPSAVIPGRVKSALDVLTEGVVMVDEEEQIVMANKAFESLTDNSMTELMGRKLSTLDWRRQRTSESMQEFPWLNSLRCPAGNVVGAMALEASDGTRRSLSVNSASILDDKGQSRGAMVTFDDVTDLETRNEELRSTVTLLKNSRDEIQRQNERLEILATRDSLTNCLNRRAFNDALEAHLQRAMENHSPLSCVMLDIDHFKSVNDTFGHQVGDKAIVFVAKRLNAGLRSMDIIGRYGGEEFCALLPNCGLESAVQVAESLRASIEDNSLRDVPDLGKRTLTASFGISCTTGGAETAMALLQEADRALYDAKETGRNCVRTHQSNTPRQLATA